MSDPETVYERPATTFVAGFIGVSNLMPGEVVSANGAGTELLLDAGPTVRTEDSGGARTGERAHAVVRPEKLVLDPEDAPAARPDVQGQVESSLYLGTATQMVVKLGEGTRDRAGAERGRGGAQGSAGSRARARLSWSAREHPHREMRQARTSRPRRMRGTRRRRPTTNWSATSSACCGIR